MALGFLHAFFSWLDPRCLVRKGPNSVCKSALSSPPLPRPLFLAPLGSEGVCALWCCYGNAEAASEK